MKNEKATLHITTVLMLGISASFWAVLDRTFFVSGAWLCLLWFFVLLFDPGEIRHFFKRLIKTGIVLLAASFLQIVFRRQGSIVLEIAGFVLIFSDGLSEAGLMWIRYMILIELAFLMARISLFDLLLFFDKIRLPLSLGLLLLTAFRLIPRVFAEAKRTLWFFQFRGIWFNSLRISDKWKALQQILYALLMRSVAFQLDTALALELRGYGQEKTKRLYGSAPLKNMDAMLILMLLGINIWAVWMSL